MLNKEEELRLASFIASLRDDVKHRREETDLTPKALLWLAEKFKECNDELKEVAKEVERNNAVPRVYKNPKNEISDRFYPR